MTVVSGGSFWEGTFLRQPNSLYNSTSLLKWDCCYFLFVFFCLDITFTDIFACLVHFATGITVLFSYPAFELQVCFNKLSSVQFKERRVK